jgi:hypothetical protein
VQRLHDPVRRQQDPLALRPSIRFGGEARFPQRGEVFPAIIQFGRVGGDAQRARQPDDAGKFLRLPPDLVRGQSVDRRCRLAPEVPHGLVEKLRQAREHEATVAARRARTDRPGVETDRAHAERPQFLQRHEPRTAQPDDADIRAHRPLEPGQRVPRTVVPDREVHREGYSPASLPWQVCADG